MLVKEVYEKVNGNYEDIKSRLRSDEIIEKFLKKFLDEKSYDALIEAASENDVQEAIQAAHKMKGVVANLSFTKIHEVLVDLLKDLRTDNQDVVNMEIVNKVTQYYNEIIEAIKNI